MCSIKAFLNIEGKRKKNLPFEKFQKWGKCILGFSKYGGGKGANETLCKMKIYLDFSER